MLARAPGYRGRVHCLPAASAVRTQFRRAAPSSQGAPHLGRRLSELASRPRQVPPKGAGTAQPCSSARQLKAATQLSAQLDAEALRVKGEGVVAAWCSITTRLSAGPGCVDRCSACSGSAASLLPAAR